MNEQELLNKLCADVNAAAQALVKRRHAAASAAAPHDACANCYSSYDACMKRAASDMEQAVCGAALSRCVANNC